MDDTLKIRVLMIYYEHWGRKELQARKTIAGIDKTMTLLSERFQTEDRTLRDGLKRMFCYLCNEDLLFFWTDFVDVFLQDMGGCFEPMSMNDPYDEDELLFDRKILLEDYLNISSVETSDLIYDNEFGEREILSVNAIVALM